MNRYIVPLFIALLMVVAPACRSQDSALPGAYPTRSSRGDISFDLTPRLTGDDQLVVNVRANTHSGDLADLDLKTLVSLQAEGRTHHPIAATGLRGHHAAGSVTFALDARPERFAITMATVRGMGEQRFEWP